MRKSFILVLLLLGTSIALADVRPPAQFGNAITVQRGQVGSYHAVQAVNARGDIFRGLYESKSGLYVASDIRPAQVQGRYAKAANTINGKISQTVPKKAVTSAVAKTASKVITRGIPYVGQAALAYDLYKVLAEQNGYTQECEQGMCKPNDGSQSLVFLAVEANSIKSEMTMTEFETWCKQPVSLDYLSPGATSRSCSNLKIVDGSTLRQPNFFLSQCPEGATSLNAHNVCLKGNMYMPAAVKMTKLIGPNIPFTEADFMAVAEAAADKAIEKWIKAAEAEQPLPWSEPKVYLLPGQIAQSNPYTNPETGKPEQARWKVVDDPSAPGENSKVEEEVIARPDLTPNSPEAPALSPDTGNNTGTGNDTGTETGKDDPKQQTDTQDLCEKNPDILACDKLPDDKPSASEPNFSIPEEVVNIEFSPDSIFPDNGVCPAPVSFDLSIGSSTKTFAFTYDYVCDVAAKLRGLLIAVAWLVVAFFATKALRNA